MKDREFENLKPGDRVFYVTNWWDGTEEYKAYELEVKGKKTEKDGQKIVLTYCESGDKNCRCGGHNLDAGGVGLTKAEAWKAEIELVEGRIKRKEAEIAEDRECLDRYKAELAKARAEEGKEKVKWFVDFNNGVVLEQVNGITQRIVEPHLCGLYSTETEAYWELAKYYSKKTSEAIAKHAELIAKERGWKND